MADPQCFMVASADGGYEKLCLQSDGSMILAEGEGEMPPAVLSAFSDLDNAWVILCGLFVFFMQCGFMVLEAGAVRRKNTVNIVFKNLMDASIGAMVWFIFGFAFAFGSDSDTQNGFIGYSNFALVDGEDDLFVGWFFQFAFAACTATIVSGAVAERMKLTAYFTYSIVITFFIYPVVVHWVWGGGWLAEMGYVDFAGSSVVHMVGGVAAFVGAWVLGPRRGRFPEPPQNQSRRHSLSANDSAVPRISGPHNVILQAIGTMILWTGWYGFNCGSTLMVTGQVSHLASKVATTTTLSAASGAIGAVLVARTTRLGYQEEKMWDVGMAMNGILGGLVSITAGCATISTGWSIPVGFIGGIVMVLGSALMAKWHVDDPLDAVAVHGFCGAWGTIAVGIFSTTTNLNVAGLGINLSTGELFGVQLLGVLMIFLWTFALSYLLFKGTDLAIGLRVSKDVELIGLDIAEHHRPGYDLQDFAASPNKSGREGGVQFVSKDSVSEGKIEVELMDAKPKSDEPRPSVSRESVSVSKKAKRTSASASTSAESASAHTASANSV